MLKDLCHSLNLKIGGLPFVDKHAGLVQTLEYKAEGVMPDNGNNAPALIKRYPISCDVDDAENSSCSPNNGMKDLVPDSTKRGIMYWENNGGISPLPKVRNGFQYEARLRLVCWLNRNLLTNDPNLALSTVTMTYITGLLTNINPWNDGPFATISAVVRNIPAGNASLFSPYTYDQTELQYLLPPYEAWGIDFGVKFTTPLTCMTNLDFKPKEGC